MSSTKESVTSELRLRHLQIKESEGGSKATAAEIAAAGGGREEAESEEPVTPAGRMFLQPDLYCNILCTIGFEKTINLAEFKQALRKTLLNHKRFTSIVEKNRKGVEIWVETEVDMDAHVFEPSGISEAEIATPGFVEKFVCDLSIAPPMLSSRPLWECHVLNGTTGNAAAAHAVLRMHHSLGDGTSLMSLLLACTRQRDHPEKLPSIPALRTRSTTAQSFLQSVWKMLVLLGNTVWGISYFLATVLWLKDSESIIKGESGVEQQPKLLVHTVIDIKDMQFVKNAIGGTINDVLLGMVGASLHRYLQGRYNKASTLPADKNAFEDGHEQEVQANAMKIQEMTIDGTTGNGAVFQTKKASKNVATLRIRAAALLNTRASLGLQELAAMMEGGSPVRWGNHMGYLVFPISLKHYSDPLDHVRAAKKLGDRKKASLEGIFTFWSGTILTWLGGPKLPTMLTRHAILQTTLTVSNIPGPIEPVMLDNNPIVHIFPVVSGHPQSLCFYLQSYAGKAGLVVMATKHLIPDPETLGQYCIDALEDMKKAAASLKAQSN